MAKPAKNTICLWYDGEGGVRLILCTLLSDNPGHNPGTHYWFCRKLVLCPHIYSAFPR